MSGSYVQSGSNSEHWYKEGTVSTLHRLDGPAVRRSSWLASRQGLPMYEWWVDGVQYSEERFRQLFSTRRGFEYIVVVDGVPQFIAPVTYTSSNVIYFHPYNEGVAKTIKDFLDTLVEIGLGIDLQHFDRSARGSADLRHVSVNYVNTVNPVALVKAVTSYVNSVWLPLYNAR